MTSAWTTKLSFAASGTASGLVSNGVSYFLLLYYSQVLGLDPALAGFALLIALLVDAVSDPLIGRWSDRLGHRWGRRHPFLFFSIVPVALAYYLLWDVPELSETGLFVYLLVLAGGLRLALTTHVVPFNSLLPEIAEDYDYRTQLMNYSYSAAWFLGTLMAVAMYVHWLADSPEYPDGAGILRAEGYVEAGLVAGVVILVCLAIAALGTRNHIPALTRPPAASGSLRSMAFEALAALADRSLVALMLSGLFSAAASGTSTALWAYMQPYFWGFDSAQTSAILFAQLSSAVIAFYITPWFTRGREKKRALIQLSVLSLFIGSGPVFLSLLGCFPTGEYLFPTMVVIGVVQVALIVMTGTLTASMIADLVEARAVETGRREEGLLYSVQSFVSKVASGVGVWMGGVLLAVIEFPTETAAAAVDASMGDALGWWYAPALTVFYGVSIICLTFYAVDRAAHQRNLLALQRS